MTKANASQLHIISILLESKTNLIDLRTKLSLNGNPTLVQDIEKNIERINEVLHPTSEEEAVYFQEIFGGNEI